MTSEQKVKQALAALDSAVQEWYAEHNPENKDHYASAYICDYLEGECANLHASRVTVQIDAKGDDYKDIASSKCSKELR